MVTDQSGKAKEINIDFKKILSSGFLIGIGFTGGLLFFFIEGVLLSVNPSVNKYYIDTIWPYISSTGLNTVLALISFYLGALLSISITSLLFRKFSLKNKLLLALFSLGLIWWFLWSIRDWWFFN